MLRGASMMQEFPSLTGTVNLESLTLTGTKITSIPKDLCDVLSLLRTLTGECVELWGSVYNQIQALPSLQGCVKLRKCDLQHNQLQQIDRDTFHGLGALRILDLSQNQIKSIHRDGFLFLSGLTNLDLSQNALGGVPTAGLSALSQLKLSGNLQMKQPLSAQSLPKLRSISVPYAYQCCAFIGCDTPVSTAQEASRKRASGDEDMERVSLVMHCSPSPGAFKPCEHLLGSWMIRLTVWFICVVALLFNGLVLVVTFSRRGDVSIPSSSSSSSSAPPLSSARLLVGLLALANLLTGVYATALVGMDAWAWGAFARVGVWWESSGACAGLGALAVFSAEWAVLLLVLAAVERSVAVRGLLGKEAGTGAGGGACHRGNHGGGSGAALRRRFVWAAALLALLAAVAGLLTLLPGNGVSEDGVSSSSSSASPLCLPFLGASSDRGEGRWLGVTVALTLLNALAYLLTAGVYTQLYCGLGRAQLVDPEQAAAVRHVAWLIFTNCIFFCPVAAFSFSPLLAAAGTAAGPDIAKSVLLIFFPLPACLNPALYAFFSPAFREDWLRLRGRGRSSGTSTSAMATGACCGGGRGGAKWASAATSAGLVGDLGVTMLEGRVAEEDDYDDDEGSRVGGRGYACGYRQLGGIGEEPAMVACQHCCQVALLARNSSSSASPSSSSSSSSSASGCRHLVKSHSCPALTPDHAPSGPAHHTHHHHHHHHGPAHGLPLRPEGLWDSGTPSAQSEYADEGDSLVSDSSEQVQACGRACFCHSRGLPLVHYAYTQPR
ncbi:hypothetical protein ACEWY4_027770 [Coilia grayii]|uniref:Leucine-rich repeat-containing G-protein coupled receptor 4 n=1 Tax=Coilia grayii TaxID=363190 RepID=A0ABD1INS4_9TELE